MVLGGGSLGFRVWGFESLGCQASAVGKGAESSLQSLRDEMTLKSTGPMPLYYEFPYGT